MKVEPALEILKSHKVLSKGLKALTPLASAWNRVGVAGCSRGREKAGWGKIAQGKGKPIKQLQAVPRA